MKLLLHCTRCGTEREVLVDDVVCKKMPEFFGVPQLYCLKCLTDENVFSLIVINIIDKK